MTFFGFFFSVAHLHIQTQLFIPIKISYRQLFREIMGGQRIRTFSAKMTPQAKKMTFFRIFFLLLHIFTSRRNFFVFTKISYLQPFREIMGGQGKSVTSTTNDERRRRTTTTNDEERTTNYIDDDNSPPGFFQNPRANNNPFSLFLHNIFTSCTHIIFIFLHLPANEICSVILNYDLVNKH